MNSKDYQLIFKVKNGKLLHMMRSYGHETIRELSKASGIGYQQLVNVANLKTPAYKKDFTLRSVSKRLVDYFNCDTFDIFPEEVMYEALKKNQASLEFTSEELRAFMPSLGFDINHLEDEIDNKQTVKELSETWSTRETRVMINHFWDGATIKEIGESEGISGGRITQIITRAKNKSLNLAKLKGFIKNNK
jgi:hypothetical protein